VNAPAPSKRRTRRKRSRGAKRGPDWETPWAKRGELPQPLTVEALREADDIAFAGGQLRYHRDAIALREAAYALQPTWRRASALAYLHYDAAMALGRSLPGDAEPLSRQEAVEGFRRWIEEALTLRPDSIKDLYRLGVFEAQVEAAHDAAALRAFLRAIELYRALPPAKRRGDLHKAYVKCLYAGARSALRRKRPALARRLAFACIREDAKTSWVAPVFRFDMAARVCLATGELDAAERAVRLALQGKGPPQRKWLHARMAEVLRARGEPEQAIAWIEQHLRPERRPSWIWRLLGDLQAERGLEDEALVSWQAAVQEDRHGKHLTWTRLADLFARRGELGRADRTYKKAIRFARRRWNKEHRPALAGLERVREQRGTGELAGGPRKCRPAPDAEEAAA
jgi:tetratricopeptide (TPR) repeat protein